MRAPSAEGKKVAAGGYGRGAMSKAAKVNPHGGYARGGPVKAPAADPAPGAGDPPGGPYGPDPAAGPVVGPGGPTADAVPINASNGEFVIPAAVVSYLGQKFFQDLMTKTMAEMAGGQPNPFGDIAGPVPGDMTGMTGP